MKAAIRAAACAHWNYGRRLTVGRRVLTNGPFFADLNDTTLLADVPALHDALTGSDPGRLSLAGRHTAAAPPAIEAPVVKRADEFFAVQKA